eukprot:TRINITY_DN7709_c0_g1_i1.p1 TRINITY_DN7709_c0_g1~~TRINITY_DN7709_c0_g1_i1.p1  ORF type:complete len:328 (+),score=115.18 TRINITY_DN7709_c0_g1_i1:54-1037(+)
MTQSQERMEDYLAKHARLVKDIEDDYEVVRDNVDGLIGSGAYGSVWRARRRCGGGLVAMKKVEKAKAWGRKARLDNEVDVLKRVQHRNIVQLHDLAHTSEHVFVVMEHCTGCELFAYIFRQDKKRVPAARAARITNQLLQAVAHLQHHCVAHRDIKPENVMIDPDTLHVALVDFGFAVRCPEGARTVAIAPCGTARFMSLDVIEAVLRAVEGHEVAVPAGTLYKADVYSVGVVAYVMLTGKFPYSGNSEAGGRGASTSSGFKESLLILAQQIRRGYPAFPVRLASVLPMSALEYSRNLLCGGFDTAREALEDPTSWAWAGTPQPHTA